MASPQAARRAFATLAALLALCVPLTGCLVAGYSSGGGLWIWPGSVVITLLLVIFYFLMRHR